MLFLSFPESEISEDRLPSVFVRVVSPVERGSGKTPKNLRLYRWLVLSARGLRRFPFFCCYRTPGYRRIPFPLPLSFPFPGFRPTFPFFLSLGCECQLTHWSPELGQRVVPPFRRFHTATSAARSRKRQQSIDSYNSRTNVQPVNFEVGKYVLVADVQASVGSKLKVQWKGPFRVVRLPSAYVSTVQDLISGNERDVHNTRINFYSDSQLNVNEELLATVEHNSPHFETVTKMTGLRFNSQKNQYEVQCKWRNFAHEEPTWEPLQNLQEDVPEFLDKFLTSYENQDLVSSARSSLSGEGNVE